MRHLLVFIALCLGFSLSAQKSDTYHRAKILLEGQSIQELAKLGMEVDHGDYAPSRYLINDFSERELDFIQNAGFSYEILIPDVAKFYADPSRNVYVDPSLNKGGGTCDQTDEGRVFPYATPSNFHLGSMGGFPTYTEMLDILDSMRLLYPNLINTRQTISNIATHGGRPVFWLRISDNPDTDETTEPEVLYTALHHAREPNSMMQMIYYMWYLLENYDTDPEIQYLVDHTEMYFVPCVNPDGYLFNEEINPNGGGLWRKNRKANADGTMGVDLNRNYGYKWAFDDSGSSPNPASDVYRGTAGFSEPETQAIKFLCEQHEFAVTLNYHTYGNLLIYPWGYSDMPTDNSLSFTTLANIMTDQNDYTKGTGTETVGYTVNGDADDWMYGETETKPAILSMTPEVGTDGFWPAIGSIIPNCKASLWMNLVAAHAPHIAGIVSDKKSQREITEDNLFLNFKIQRFGLLDGPLTVSLSSLQTDMLGVSEEPKTYNLDENESQLDSFALSINGNIPAGTELVFLLSIDNGVFVRTDTIKKAFGGFIATPVFSDPISDSSNWTSDEWATTNESFVSAPNSMTDSPNTSYANNVFNEILLNAPIFVGDAEQYRLKFWAHWDIEANYDYVQLSFRVNGGGWIPACGRYTVLGSNLQDTGQPLWEGQQNEWVEEAIDLSTYLSDGDQLELRFVLVSDQYENPDGFYFDDLVLEELTMETVGASYLLSNDRFTLNIHPNPSFTESQLQFRLPSEYEGHGEWTIRQSDGKKIMTGDLNLINGYDQVKLNTYGLAAGIYWVSAKGNQWQVPARKLVIVQ